MAGKKKAGKLPLSLALLALATLAVGCGGGGANSSSNGMAYVPSSGPQQMANVSLTFVLSGHGAASRKRGARSRRPQYISNQTRTISLQVVPSGAPSPWPSPITTTIPSPAPSVSPCACQTASPAPITFSTSVPAGNDVFIIDARNANGYVLSTTRGFEPTPMPNPSGGPPIPIGRNQVVVPSTTNNLTITLLPVIDFAELTTSDPHLLNNGVDLAFAPLANQRTTQTMGVYMGWAWDADGFDISPPFANSVSLVPGYIQNPCCITGGAAHTRHPSSNAAGTVTLTNNNLRDFNAGAPVVMQYPAGSGAGAQFHAEIPAGPDPQPTSGSNAILTTSPSTVEIDPNFYAFIPNGNYVNIIEGATPFNASNAYGASEYAKGSPVGGLYGARAVASGGIQSGSIDYGCPGSAYAVVDDNGDGSSLFTISIPVGGASAGPPVRSNPMFINNVGALTIGAGCTAYELERNGRLKSVAVNGVGSEIALTPAVLYSWDMAAQLSDGNLYGPNVSDSGYMYGVSTGGAAANTGILSGAQSGIRKVVASPDRSILYFDYTDGTNYHLASCLAPCTSILHDVALASGASVPRQMTINHSGSAIYLSAADNTLYAYDAATLNKTDSTLIGTILGLAVSPDDSEVFVLEDAATCGTSAASNCLSARSARALATATNWNAASSYPVGSSPAAGLAISP